MAQYELNLRDYYRIFLRRKITIFLVMVIVVAASSYPLWHQSPRYQSSIKVKIAERKPVVGTSYGIPIGDLMQTQQEIIKSRPVAERAAKLLGWLEGVLSQSEADQVIQKVQKSVGTEQILETSVIRVTVTTSELHLARPLAEAVAKSYIAFDVDEKGRSARSRRRFIEEELQKAIERLQRSEEALQKFKREMPQTGRADQLRNQISTLETQYRDLLLRATPKHPDAERLREEIRTTREELLQIPQEDLPFAHLTQEVGDNQGLVSQLKQKYNEARIIEAENVSDISIIEEATSPTPTLTTNRRLAILLSALIGLLAGFIVAFIQEELDTSLGAIEDVESFLGIEVLGVVPHVTKGESKRFPFSGKKGLENKRELMNQRLVTQFDPRSPEAEAYHTLRTAIYSVLPQKEKLALAVTSTGPKEGKSLTCANLAVASAQIGKKTLLIDADFRRPMVHEIFGIERIPGLFEILTKTVNREQAVKNVTDLLMGDLKWQEALKTPHLAYLNFLTAGHLPPNPPELLHSQEMEDLIHVLLSEYDLLIFDCPPVLPVADTLILAPKLDGVILVYQAGRTARNALKRAKMQLETAQAKILGIVFNDVRPIEMETSSSYYYRYRKYYSDEKKDKKEEETAEA